MVKSQLHTPKKITKMFSKSFKSWKYPKNPKTYTKNLEIFWDTMSPSKIIGAYEKDF